MRQRWIGLVVLFVVVLALLTGNLVLTRLANSGDLAVAAAEQRRITTLRLCKLLGET